MIEKNQLEQRTISKNKYKFILTLIGISFILEIIIGVGILIKPFTEYNIYYAFLSLMTIIASGLSWYFLDKLDKLEVKENDKL
jgi:hypothetical protein